MSNLTYIPGKQIKNNKTGLLFIHGFTATNKDFEEWVSHFSKEGYVTENVLLSGHGTHYSNLVNVKWYTWFNDVKEALFTLRKKCENVVVIGQSMGGSLALHLAAHYQIEGLVLLAPGIFFKENNMPLLRLLKPFKKYLKKKDGVDIKNSEVKKDIVSYEKIAINAIFEVDALFNHVKDDLPDVYVPVILFHAKEDHVIDYKSSEFAYNTISSKIKKILTLKNSYHLLSLDNDKDIIIKETDKFLRQIFS